MSNEQSSQLPEAEFFDRDPVSGGRKKFVLVDPTAGIIEEQRINDPSSTPRRLSLAQVLASKLRILGAAVEDFVIEDVGQLLSPREAAQNPDVSQAQNMFPAALRLASDAFLEGALPLTIYGRHERTVLDHYLQDPGIQRDRQRNFPADFASEESRTVVPVATDPEVNRQDRPSRRDGLSRRVVLPDAQ